MPRSTPWMALVFCLAAPALLLAASKPQTPASIPPQASKPTVQLTGLAAELALQFPSLANQITPSTSFKSSTMTVGASQVSGLEAQPAHMVSDFLRTARGRDLPQSMPVASILPAPSHFRVLFPSSYGETIAAKAGGVKVALRALNGNDVLAIDEGGTLTYRDAYLNTDSLQIAMASRTEEFLRLRSPKAPTYFEYEITAMEGVRQVTLNAGKICFVNDKGQGLEISKPWVVDARGRRNENAGHWELGPEPVTPGSHRKIALVINPKGLAYPLLIDPSFAESGTMLVARDSHTATLLSDGRILATGGLDSANQALNTWEIYDPVTEGWTTNVVHPTMSYARVSHTATLLRNGKVLVAGGRQGSTYLKSAELFDPSSMQWTPVPDMGERRAFHTATLLDDANGCVLVVGGKSSVSPVTCTNTAEIYDPVTNSWSYTGYMAGEDFVQTTMSTAREGHTATSLSNIAILVIGGTPDDSTPLSSSEIYNPSGGTWTPLTNSMADARFFHTATLFVDSLDSSKKKIIVAGGTADGTSPMASSEIYNPSTSSWIDTVPGPLNTARFWHTATLLPDGQVLIIGGCDNGDTYHPIASWELFDPSSGSWNHNTGDDLNYARLSHTATLLPTAQVVVAGGFDGTADVPISERSDVVSGGPYTGGKPTLDPLNSTTICLGTSYVSVSGSIFNGLSECSGGNGSQNSATNYPLLEVTDSLGHVTYLPVDPTVGWTPFSFQSIVVNGIATGTAHVRIITNGIPSHPTVISSPTITVNAPPSVFSVTGGGSYCSGGAGVAVGLSGSEMGVNYQLYGDSSPLGSPVSGTGGAISFGNQATAGTYTVVATNAMSGCSANMTGSVTVTVGASPSAYSVSGGGSYCSGGSGVAVGLSGSEAGVNYQLKKDGSDVGTAVSGTGSALNFGNQTAAGTYTVFAANATTGCTANMTGKPDCNGQRASVDVQRHGGRLLLLGRFGRGRGAVGDPRRE